MATTMIPHPQDADCRRIVVPIMRTLIRCASVSDGGTGAREARSTRRRIQRRMMPVSSRSSWRRFPVQSGLAVIFLLLLTTWLHLSSSAHAAAAPAVKISNPQRKNKARIASKQQQSPAASTSTRSSIATVTTHTQHNNKAAGWNGLKSGAASASAAACVKTLLQPVDAVKTVQQFASTNVSLRQAAQILWERPGGFLNFYAGWGVTVIGSLPGVSLYFGVYSYCKQLLLTRSDWGGRHKTASIALSAAIGNTVASFSRVPYEVVKQKLQAGVYDTTGAALRDALKHPTTLLFPKGGVWTQMLRDVPYAVVTLLLYESLQQRFGSGNKTESSSQKPPSPTKQRLLDFVVGGTAGGIGSWVTNPMDVVKTRLQTQPGGGTVWPTIQKIYQEGGASAFLRGAVPRLLHKVPANAFFFYFYELFKRLYRVEE